MSFWRLPWDISELAVFGLVWLHDPLEVQQLIVLDVCLDYFVKKLGFCYSPAQLESLLAEKFLPFSIQYQTVPNVILEGTGIKYVWDLSE